MYFVYKCLETSGPVVYHSPGMYIKMTLKIPKIKYIRELYISIYICCSIWNTFDQCTDTVLYEWFVIFGFIVYVNVEFEMAAAQCTDYIFADIGVLAVFCI